MLLLIDGSVRTHDDNDNEFYELYKPHFLSVTYWRSCNPRIPDMEVVSTSMVPQKALSSVAVAPTHTGY